MGLRITAGLMLTMLAPPTLASGGEVVTVVGVADIAASGGEAAARDQAIANAQRAALEQVLGTLVKSEFSVEQQETVSGGDANFSSNVEDRIYTKTEGFIARQRVLSSKVEGGTLRVTLEAEVRAESLKAELGRLQELMAVVGYPRVMVVHAERYIDADNYGRWLRPPAATAAIEDGLLRFGFDMVGRDRAAATLGDQDPRSLLNDDRRLMDLGRGGGADVVIAGTTKVTFSDYNVTGNQMYYLAAVVSIRAVSADGGRVLASFESIGRGTGVSEDQARLSAIGKATPKIIKRLLDSLIQTWRLEAEQGRRFEVQVAQVRSYRGQGRALLKEFKKLKGMKSAKELGYDDRTLRLELRFMGNKEELLEAIFAGIPKKKKFKKLDKLSDTGGALRLSL